MAKLSSILCCNVVRDGSERQAVKTSSKGMLWSDLRVTKTSRVSVYNVHQTHGLFLCVVCQTCAQCLLFVADRIVHNGYLFVIKPQEFADGFAVHSSARHSGKSGGLTEEVDVL